MNASNKGVVAAGHAVTAQAAADILSAGGNAFDAAVAAMAAACVCEPVLASLGGGGFLMAHQAGTGETELYDFFAQTPRLKADLKDIEFKAIHADFGPATQEFHIGAGTSAVPGVIPGLFAIHNNLCTRPIHELFQPAIQAAQQGVTIDKFNAYLLTVVAPILTYTSEVAGYFAPDGQLLKQQETYKNPELAECFEILGSQGLRAASDGPIAQAMLSQSKDLGGQLTSDDLKEYQVIKRKPLKWEYNKSTLALNPAPAASGTLIAFGLGLIEKEYSTTPLSAHEYADILQKTNAARETLQVTTEQRVSLDKLTQSLETIQTHQKATRGTTHISIIDQKGNAVAVTLSNGEGNGRIVENCGFMLNNMLGEEDVNPAGLQKWSPGTRLSSMMAPTIIQQENGDITALGSGGSNRIRSAILQVIVGLIQGKSLQQAIERPRLHVEKCDAVNYEALFDQEEERQLLAQFPNAKAWPEVNLFFGGVHAVKRKIEGCLEGAGDPRRSGVHIIAE
ncbi:MAG: gamma-glutamyltransferase [Pseudomonadota bacterium]